MGLQELTLLRALLPIACLWLLVPAAPAWAEDLPSLDARDFELLPLNELEKKEFARDHAELTRKVTVLARRINTLRGHLAGRDGMDAGSHKLATQIEQLEADLAPLMAEAVARVRETQPGVDAALLDHIRNAPQGARRTARYAAGLPLFVEGVPEASRAILRRMLPRYEGALIALDAQQQRLRALAGDDASKRVAAEEVEAQMRRMERRYWRLVDYILPEAARAAVHRVLPTAYQRQADVLRYLYAVPDLKPSQATRISALLKEIESESAPDQAAVKRLTATQPSGGAAQRRDALRDAQERLLELQRFAVVQAKSIYTKDQWRWLEAVPPRVPFAERSQTSPQVLKGVTLSPAQQKRLKAMREELRGVRLEYAARVRATKRQMSEYGADSPQMAGMRMQMAAIQSDGSELQRAFNGRLFLELLTPAQVEAWILAPSEG